MSDIQTKYKQVFFIGIGGIGMSALARYFARMGMLVAGYDSTPSPLIKQLILEGINIHFADNTELIPSHFKSNPNDTLVVYTPAISNSHSELKFFLENNFTVVKRAKALGLITNSYSTAAVAGTHGKTSTSTLLAHLLSQTPQGCNAFLGGISKNFDSNLVLKETGSTRMVVEADEFDRSFLHITPQLAIITSTDADHLDIYKTHSELLNAFSSFISNITPGGVLIVKKGLEDIAKNKNNIKVYTYSATEEADFYASNVTHVNGHYCFNLVTPLGVINNLSLGVLGKYNVENAVAASGAAVLWGINHDQLANGLKTFKGVTRRFDLQFSGKKSIYIDDYAHHPQELKVAIGSAREMFPDRKITGIFQPHLYSRTKDFANEFALSLSLLDQLILLDIYPARELPINGVTSEIILNRVTCKQKTLCSKKNLITYLEGIDIDILITLGAGDIDREVDNITNMLKTRELING